MDSMRPSDIIPFSKLSVDDEVFESKEIKTNEIAT